MQGSNHLFKNRSFYLLLSLSSDDPLPRKGHTDKFKIFPTKKFQSDPKYFETSEASSDWKNDPLLTVGLSL